MLTHRKPYYSSHRVGDLHTSPITNTDIQQKGGVMVIISTAQSHFSRWSPVIWSPTTMCRSACWLHSIRRSSLTKSRRVLQLLVCCISPADEEIIGSSWCQLKVCAIESAKCAHPRCYGASMGFRKGLLCGSCVIHMQLQVCIGG
jgi:hypothetical protein